MLHMLYCNHPRQEKLLQWHAIDNRLKSPHVAAAATTLPAADMGAVLQGPRSGACTHLMSHLCNLPLLREAAVLAEPMLHACAATHRTAAVALSCPHSSLARPCMAGGCWRLLR